MADSIIVNAPLAFKRWSAPNFAVLESREASIAVREMGRPALEVLAQAWIDDLFEKAGHIPPRLSTPEGER